MATGVVKTGRIQEQYLSMSVAGAVDVTLSASQYKYGILELTGAISANISAILPLENGNRWVVKNSTTGNFTLTIKGSSGTGVIVPRGKTISVWTDGTNFYRAIVEPVRTNMLVGGVIVADTTVTASVVGTTETAVWTDYIEPSRLSVADLLRIDLFGIATRSGSGPTLRIRLRLGTGTLTTRPVLADSGSTSTSVGGFTNAMWNAYVLMAIRTIGGTGTIYPQGALSMVTTGTSMDNRAFTTAGTVAGGSTAAVTVDTTASGIELTLTVEWGANTAGNSVTINVNEPLLEAA